MNNASLELGGTNWAEKDASLLGYTVSDDSGRFFPQEFTFSRGSNLAATRIGKTGLIEKGRENLLVQSNQFDTTWGNTDITITGGQSDRDGGSNAWKFDINAGTAAQNVRQGVSNSGVTTFSLYLKAGTLNWSLVQVLDGGSNPAAYFDLQNGAVGNITGGAINASIEAAGNGYYRCSVQANGNITQARIYPATADNNITQSSGSIYIQDAQLEQGLAASPYIPTTTTTAQAGVLENTPRLNYTTGVANPSLLLEPSRTNLIRQTEYLGSIFNGNRMAINDLVDTSPEGLVNASKLVPNTTPNSTHQSNTSNYGSFVSGDKITISIFAKADGFDGIILRLLNGSGAFTTNRIAKFDLSRGRWENDSMDGTTGVMEGAVGMEALANGWYRCWATATADAAGDVDIRIPVADVTAEDDYDEVFTGDGTSGVLIYGLQLEAGSYPTSYIPNHSGGSVTRGSETCGKTGVSSLIGQTEGTIFFEWSKDVLNFGSDYSYFQVGSYPSYVGIYIQASKCVCEVVNAGAVQATITKNSVSIGTHKAAVAYANNDISFYFDGVQVGTDSLATIPATSQVYLNSNNGIAEKIKQALIFKERLTNAELITLTTI